MEEGVVVGVISGRRGRRGLRVLEGGFRGGDGARGSIFRGGLVGAVWRGGR